MFKLNLIHDPSVAAATNAAPPTQLSTKSTSGNCPQDCRRILCAVEKQRIASAESGSTKTIAVIGANAVARFAHGGGSAMIKPPYEITALEGISNRLGGNVKLIYAKATIPPSIRDGWASGRSPKQ